MRASTAAGVSFARVSLVPLPFLSVEGRGGCTQATYTHGFLGLRDKGPKGVLPYMGYIGMRGLKGYGFSAILA